MSTLSNRMMTQPESNGFADVVNGNFSNRKCSRSRRHYNRDENCDSPSNGVGSKPHGKGRVMLTDSEEDEPAFKRVSNNFVGGYVRRLAARNASACVNAILESPKKSGNAAKSKNFKTNDQYKSTVSRTEDFGVVERKRMARKRKNPEDTPIEVDQKRNPNNESSSGYVPPVSGSDVCHKDDSSSVESGSVSSRNIVNSNRSSPDATNNPDQFFEYSDDFPYNLEGLLYNGDCIHTESKYYLKSKSNTIENRVIPCVIPSSKDSVTLLKDRYTDTEKMKHKALKGNNGWSPVGSPIKIINIIDGKDKRRIQRKYFIGIKRKKETLFTRDSILIRSKEGIPYIAKISSIWQEPGSNLMVTVFWYYRKEDITDPSNLPHFIDMEVMASQHHDDISVACIDDKCHVLGLSEFYRFKAKLEMLPKLKAARCTQSLSKLNQGIVKFNIQDPQFEELLKSEVYLCFRAYNHITGKVLKV